MIGDRIREFRKEKGFKVAEFAALIGISQGSLSDIENNKTKPSAETLSAIVRKTDVNPGWLLTGEKKTYSWFGDSREHHAACVRDVSHGVFGGEDKPLTKLDKIIELLKQMPELQPIVLKMLKSKKGLKDALDEMGLKEGDWF